MAEEDKGFLGSLPIFGLISAYRAAKAVDEAKTAEEKEKKAKEAVQAFNDMDWMTKIFAMLMSKMLGMGPKDFHFDFMKIFSKGGVDEMSKNFLSSTIAEKTGKSKEEANALVSVWSEKETAVATTKPPVSTPETVAQTPATVAPPAPTVQQPTTINININGLPPGAVPPAVATTGNQPVIVTTNSTQPPAVPPSVEADSKKDVPPPAVKPVVKVNKIASVEALLDANKDGVHSKETDSKELIGMIKQKFEKMYADAEKDAGINVARQGRLLLSKKAIMEKFDSGQFDLSSEQLKQYLSDPKVAATIEKLTDENGNLTKLDSKAKQAIVDSIPPTLLIKDVDEQVARNSSTIKSSGLAG